MLFFVFSASIKIRTSLRSLASLALSTQCVESRHNLVVILEVCPTSGSRKASRSLMEIFLQQNL